MRRVATFVRTLGALSLTSAFFSGCGGAEAPAPKGTSPLRKIAELTGPAGVASPAPRGQNGRLPLGPKPQSYKLHFEVFPDKDSFRGEARINVRVEDATPFVVLHARGLAFDSITARQGTRTVRGTAEVTDETQGETALRFASPLDPGFAELVLAYHAPYSVDLEGLYRVREAGMNAAFTQFEPVGARRAFPCFDEPAFKTPYDIEVLTGKNDTAFANGREVSREERPEGMLYRFERTAPLPSYLVALAVGPLETLAAKSGGEGPEIRTVALRGRVKDGGEANEAATRLLAAAAYYTGIPYAYGKLDLVAVPNFNAGAMENPGLVTFREERLLLRSPSDRTRYSAESIIAHEFAHQWFGDYVTAKWWDEVWLNEAFATWLAAKLLDGQQPSNFRSIRDAKISASWVMDDDSMPSTHAIRAPITSAASAMEAFDGITYDKGAAVLRMLESDAGAANFQNGLHRYLSTHIHGAAGFEDLWASVVQMTQNPLRKARYRAFLDRPGVPDIDVQSRCDGGHPVVRLSQKPFGVVGMPPVGDSSSLWDVPVCFEVKEKVQCVDVSEASVEKVLSELPCDKALVPNVRMEGYYRFSVSEDVLPLLARSDIAETRMALLLNTWAHVRSGRYAPKVLVATLARFGMERDPHVLSVLSKVLAKVGDALITAPSQKAYATLVSRVLSSAVVRLPVGTTTPLGAHEAQARRDAWTTLFDHGAPSDFLQKQARDRADAALSAHAASKTDGRDRDADELSIELSARRGDEAYWKTLADRLVKTTDAQERVVLVRALASFDDETLLGRSLALALDDTIKLQDLRYLITTSTQRPASREFVLRWFDRNWDAWTKKLPAHQSARAVVVVQAACGSPSKESFTKKVEVALPTFAGWGRTYRAGMDSTKACEMLRARVGADMATALETLPRDSTGRSKPLFAP